MIAAFVLLSVKEGAFASGILSGFVEPIGALLTILAASLVIPAMPYYNGPHVKTTSKK